MNSDERICSIALGLCERVGLVSAKRLVEQLGSASEVFAHRQELSRLIPGIHPSLIRSLDNPEAFRRAERELEFAEKNHIRCLTWRDETYPSRLRECDDAPLTLFFKGNADLNGLHMLSIVGTRRATEYGKQFCASFLQDLATLCPDVLVVSGLAYGIDIHAHRAALANGLTTVGVLAHGLDRIYPHVHRKTAVEMLEKGGLLTEYLTDTNPDRYNFVARNRIVAGISDATLVVESAERGGSLITAGLALGYNRECFAVPGRATDPLSAGCNKLITTNKAVLIQHADELVEQLGWSNTRPSRPEAVQRNLFLDLTPEESLVVQVLGSRGDLHINTLVVEANIPVGRMSSLLFELEMKGVVKALVGGVYHLL